MMRWDVDLAELDKRIREKERTEHAARERQMKPCVFLMGYNPTRPLNWDEEKGRPRWR